MARYKSNRNFKQGVIVSLILLSTPFTIVLVGKLFAVTVAICFGSYTMSVFQAFPPLWVLLSVFMIICHCMLASEYDKDCKRKNSLSDTV